MRPVHFLPLLILLLPACQSEQPTNRSSDPPNILLIMTDDQGWGDLSLHGNPVLETPVLDSFARQSVRFRRFYVSPVCAPTRASLLTGRYHLRTGTSWVTHRKEAMRSEEATIAEFLQTKGYRNGLFGKWHNGSQYPNDPLGQGFDEFFGFAAGHWNNYFDTRLMHNQDTVKTEGYITDVLTDRAIQFMKENRKQPFFCYIPYNAPHSPFQVPDRYFDKYKDMGLDDKNASVYGMCENIDDNVGRLLQTLEELELSEHTIVLFLTDNGPNGDRYNGGMKGRKAQLDEGGVRVPCFIRWPGHLSAGREVAELAAHIDLLPTLMDLAGLSFTPVKPLDGHSLVPLMTQDNPSWKERSIFNVLTDGKLRLFPGAVRTPVYRLVIDRQNQTHLYHMLKDPGQKNDLVETEPVLADSLRRVYEAWFAEVTQDGIEPPSIPVGYPQAPVTELPAPEASLYGDIQFEGGMGWANDYIVNWQSPADSAVWSILPAEPGSYELGVSYTCTDAAVGASLLAHLDSNTIRRVIAEPYDPDPLTSPDRVERGEVYEKEWNYLQLGAVRLRRGRHHLSLSIDRQLPADALEVKAVWLKRRTAH